MRRQLLVVLALAACERSRGPHVTLRAPYPNAPIEERRQAFTLLKADGGIKVEKTFFLSNAPDRDYLKLANGTKVFAVEDLMPVVRESSKTGQALEKLRRARSKMTRGWLSMVGGPMIGGGLLAGGIVMIARSDDPHPVGPHSKSGGILLTVLGGGIFGFGFGYGLWAQIDGGSQSGIAAKRAFEGYNESLAETLRICAKGIELVDCETGQ